ncbi:MAG: outer membrane lipoprotein carrier protein LolA [Taibaiella sp.]|nr:outer membrane lipoprotein carrier protein LolA [Taibaiella sp.]
MMKYRIVMLVMLLLAVSFSVRAQKAGFTAMANTGALQQALAKNAQVTQSISSDFNQVKNMKMLNDKVSSKGKFYYKQSDKVRIEYTSPFSYLLVMNSGMIAVKENGKVSKINTRNSLTMQSVNKIMMDCMRGTVFNNKDFSVKAYASSAQYLLTLTPVSSAVKGLFKNIDVYINKSDNQVAKLIMTENGGDNTVMTFTNRKLNSNLADALFSVR